MYKKYFLFILTFSVYFQNIFASPTMEISNVELDEDCLMRSEEFEKPNHTTVLFISKDLQSRYPDDSTKVNITGVNRKRGEGLPYRDIVTNRQDDEFTKQDNHPSIDKSSKLKSFKKLSIKKSQL